MKKLISALLILLSPTFAFAAPTINSVSGTVTHGQTVTLNMTSAGSGSTVLLYDNFDTGSDGDLLTAHGWTKYTGSGSPDGGYVKTTNAYGGRGMSAYNDVVNGSTNKDFNTSYKTYTASLEMYSSVMHRYDYTGGDGNGTMKCLRVNSSVDGYTSDINTSVTGKPLPDGLAYINSYKPGAYMEDWFDEHISYGPYIGTGKWFRLSYWKRLSNPAGTANGAYRCWLNGILIIDVSNVNTRDTGMTDQFTTVLLGLMCPNSTATAFTMQNDDLLILNNQARVELDDGAGHTEIQKHTSWADGSITFVVNQGTFTVGQTPSVKVYDSSGNVSNSYQVTIGGSSGSTTSSLTGTITGKGTISG